MRLVVVAFIGTFWACASASRVPIDLNQSHEEFELVTARHVVAPGENLYRIALRYDVPVEDLMTANGISDPTKVEVGTELVVPAVLEGMKGRSNSEIAISRSSDVDAVKRNGLGGGKRPTPHDPIAVGQGQGIFDWPLRGVLYSRFGQRPRDVHDGIDLSAPKGTLVKVAGEGNVLFAGEQHGYGRIVIVDHHNGFITLYAHNEQVRVKTGDTVKRGQIISTVGETGRTTGPHLHFEVRKERIPVDPLLYLGPVPKE